MFRRDSTSNGSTTFELRIVLRNLCSNLHVTRCEGCDLEPSRTLFRYVCVLVYAGRSEGVADDIIQVR